MSFTDHKITQFQHKIADLPDEPQIPAAELKSRFDACPEELRQSLNAVCDDAARLEARVEGIVVDTFGDTIDKEMLSDELAAELDAKAEAADLNAEIAARTALGETVALKCEVYFGSYTGSGGSNTSKTISLGFTPQAVLVFNEDGRTCTGFNYYDYTGGLALPDKPVIGASNITVLEIVENGFTVHNHSYSSNDIMSANRGTHYFIAFR